MKKTIITLAAATVALGSATAQTIDFNIRTDTQTDTATGAQNPLGTFNVNSNSHLVSTPSAGGFLFENTQNTFNALSLNWTASVDGTLESLAAFVFNDIDSIDGSLNPNVGGSISVAGVNVGSFGSVAPGASAGAPAGIGPLRLLAGESISVILFSAANSSGEVAIGNTFSANFGGTFTADPVAVPEPSSALLLGLSALGFFSRRKR